jgi:hypothetical protein
VNKKICQYQQDNLDTWINRDTHLTTMTDLCFPSFHVQSHAFIHANTLASETPVVQIPPHKSMRIADRVKVVAKVEVQ